MRRMNEQEDKYEVDSDWVMPQITDLVPDGGRLDQQVRELDRAPGDVHQVPQRLELGGAEARASRHRWLDGGGCPDELVEGLERRGPVRWWRLHPVEPTEPSGGGQDRSGGALTGDQGPLDRSGVAVVAADEQPVTDGDRSGQLQRRW